MVEFQIGQNFIFAFYWNCCYIHLPPAGPWHTYDQNYSGHRFKIVVDILIQTKRKISQHFCLYLNVVRHAVHGKDVRWVVTK